MPRLQADRTGACAACGGPIERGEVIEYQLAVGPRHLTCVDRPAALRRNRYRTACGLCGLVLRPGEGLLSVAETATQSAYEREWRAVCADTGACDARIRGGF